MQKRLRASALVLLCPTFPCSSLFSLCRSGITTELRSGTFDKITGFFTKCIWQP